MSWNRRIMKGGKYVGNEKVLRLREGMIKFFKTYERWVVGMMKFLLCIIALMIINHHIGYVDPLAKGYIVFAIALLGIMLPIQYIIVLFMTVISGHLLVFNVIIGGISIFVFLLVYFGFIRLYPKESLIILLVMLGFPFNLHYVLVICAALLGSIGALVAICIGLIGVAGMHSLQMIIQNMTEIVSPLELVESSAEIVTSTVLFNPELLGSIVVFVGVFSIIYIVRRQSVDYAPYIAIALGAMIMLFGFGMASLFLEIKVELLTVGIWTTVGVCLAVVIQLFYRPMDYSRVENVQYEDEENYYYVKIVPKFKVGVQEQKVEQIFTTNTSEEKEAL